MVGVGVYTGYKLNKLTNKFKGKFGSGRGNYGWDDYNKWREAEGFLCRNNDDCNWVDEMLYCQDYELDFKPSVSIVPFLKPQPPSTTILLGLDWSGPCFLPPVSASCPQITTDD